MTHDNKVNLREYEGFLDKYSCDKIITLGEQGMQRAAILGSEDNGYRVADTMFFDPYLKSLKRIREVVAKQIGLPVENQEHMSIIRYKDIERGVFKPHYDTFFPEADYYQKEMQKGGQRVKTCLIYLNEDFEGGETDFPNMGIRIKPTIGKLAIWDNVDSNGEIIVESLHEGMQVTKGTKYLLSIWVRERKFDNSEV